MGHAAGADLEQAALKGITLCGATRYQKVFGRSADPRAEDLGRDFLDTAYPNPLTAIPN
jgi:hypothetical protein